MFPSSSCTLLCELYLRPSGKNCLLFRLNRLCSFCSSCDSSGQISLEEFIEGAEKDPWVMDQLKLDIGPCEWFIEQQKNP